MTTATSDARRFRHLWQQYVADQHGASKIKDDRHLQTKAARANAGFHGFRSGLELAVADDLEQAGVEFLYEPIRVPFVRPPKPSRYTPDIVLPNGIVVELKGRFQTDDRQKHLMIKDQYPRLDIRFVFSNPNQCISKQSTTTYAKWCESHGFLYAKRSVPEDWIAESPNLESQRELITLMSNQ